MNNQYLSELYNWLGSQDPTFQQDVPFEKFANDMQTNSEYAQSMYQWMGGIDPTFYEEVPFEKFNQDIKKKSRRRAYGFRLGGWFIGVCRY